MGPRRLKFVFVLSLIAVAALRVSAQDPLDAWKDFDFGKTSIKASQIQPLELQDLKMLRGIVFGRHGRIFKDSDIKAYLQEQSWFKPNPDFKNSMLNNT